MGFFSSIGKIASIVAAPFTGGGSLLPAIASGGASLLGGVLQNSSAKSIATNNNATAIELANTAHQREVKDLLAAGLNPMLSAGGSGSPTPSMQAAPVSNVVSPAISSALAVASAKAQLENMKETNENIRADTNLKNAMNEKAFYETVNSQLQQPLIAAQARAATNSARSSAVQADADEFMGSLTKELQAGGAAASTFANVLRVLKSLPAGKGK